MCPVLPVKKIKSIYFILANVSGVAREIKKTIYFILANVPSVAREINQLYLFYTS
jgi:hypothetical protein